MTAEEKFNQIRDELVNENGAVSSKMFGKESIKFNSKGISCFFKDNMVFKLPESRVKEILAWEDTVLFDPSNMGRGMKEWVMVPYTYHENWKELGKEAIAFVG
jgi:hypothetical protein